MSCGKVPIKLLNFSGCLKLTNGSNSTSPLGNLSSVSTSSPFWYATDTGSTSVTAMDLAILALNCVEIGCPPTIKATDTLIGIVNFLSTVSTFSTLVPEVVNAANIEAAASSNQIVQFAMSKLISGCCCCS